MTSVITADIINSRSANLPDSYLSVIRKSLNRIAEEGLYWEVFRGDSFQIEIQNSTAVFWESLYIKAAIKTLKGIDVRMAIGIGDKTYQGASISEANGSAFVRSGEMFEKLKQEKTNLLIKTGKKSLDTELNTYFKLALIAMDNWTPNSAELVKLSIEHPEFNQKQLGKLMAIKQNTVSERQKRAYLEELKMFNQVFQQKINQL